MSAKVQVARPRNLTLEQIDFHLTNLSNVLKHSKVVEREDCLRTIDKWLDKRNNATSS